MRILQLKSKRAEWAAGPLLFIPLSLNYLVTKIQAHTFTRAERLKSRKVIEQLFKQGQSFAQYPLRLVWTVMEERQSEFPAQFALTVPKKKFKKAVQRNRIRRLMREAYRLNKHHLYDALQKEEKQLALLVIYIGQETMPFGEIEAAMQQMLRRLIKKWRQSNQS